jgi:hypothetical protein
VNSKMRTTPRRSPVVVSAPITLTVEGVAGS